MKTLYIIGNGFDKAHSLETSYADFHDWLCERREFKDALYFADSIDGLSKEKISLWRSFEEALGKIDLKEYIKALKEDYIDIQDTDDYIAQSDSFYAGIDYIVRRQYETLISAFRVWARDIDVNGTEILYPNLNNADNYFLTFNYTNTLEKVYGILQNRVLHIHGDAADAHSKIEVGHNHDYEDDRGLIRRILDKVLPADGGDSCDKLIEVLNMSIKQVDEIIRQHFDYFQKLSRIGIEKIYVQGHSYGKVDWPYFEKIKSVCPNAKWELTWVTAKDETSAQELDQHYSLGATLAQLPLVP